MPAVTIRNLPEATLRALEVRATQNGRSTEAEIREIIETAVQLPGRIKLGFRSHELNRIRALVIEHRVAFKAAWHGHFGTEAQ